MLFYYYCCCFYAFLNSDERRQVTLFEREVLAVEGDSLRPMQDLTHGLLVRQVLNRGIRPRRTSACDQLSIVSTKARRHDKFADPIYCFTVFHK